MWHRSSSVITGGFPGHNTYLRFYHHGDHGGLSGDAFDAIFHKLPVEVQEEATFETKELQIGNHLRHMEVVEFVY